MKFRISEPFGQLSYVHPKPHTGVDFAMAEGTSLRSVVNGIVEKITHYGNENIGTGVIIKAENGQRIIYGHMRDTNVVAGQKINYGDLLGYSGNTGHSTGPHLHFGVKDGNVVANPNGYIDNIQEICGNWSHVDVGITKYAIGDEKPSLVFDVFDYILDIINILPI